MASIIRVPHPTTRPTSFQWRSQWALPEYARYTSGEGGGTIGSKTRNSLTSKHVGTMCALIQLRPRLAINCMWKSCAKILGHMGGQAGKRRGSYNQESWVAWARKTSSHGNNAKEGLLSKTEAHQSTVSILDPPHTTCVTWGKSLPLREPHYSICKWIRKPAPASQSGVD